MRIIASKKKLKVLSLKLKNYLEIVWLIVEQNKFAIFNSFVDKFVGSVFCLIKNEMNFVCFGTSKFIDFKLFYLELFFVMHF